MPPSSSPTSLPCRSRSSARAWNIDPLFPERANIGFAQILAPDRMRLRVWERGAGLTLACGSGACAAVVNAHRRGLTGNRVTVLVDGGALEIEWRGRDHRADDRTGRHRLHRNHRAGRLPGMSVEILTFGCRLNSYESEVMRGHAAGLTDTVIVNTCAVTAEAERQARQAIRRAARENPTARIVVTGCAVQVDPQAWARLPGVHRVLGNDDKLRPENWAPDAGPAVSDIMAARETAAHLVTEFAGRARAFVQVQQGCDHRCTFCIIPFGRGPNRSVPIGAVVGQTRALVAAGYQEVVLTGVDIASFGPDLPGHPTLGQLVRRLLAMVPELARLRLSSLDPAAIDADLWRLMAEEPRLMPHLHLSLQAGSDLILKRMKRRHSRAEALAVIARARRLRPGIAIGADLIAGFPTETDALFAETLDFVTQAELPFLHVFPYSERAGTPAARMPAVPKALRRERAARLRDAGRAVSRRFFATQLGRRVSVLAERGDAGHSEHFAPVRLTVPVAPGFLVTALVTGATADGLVATPVEVPGAPTLPPALPVAATAAPAARAAPAAANEAVPAAATPAPAAAAGHCLRRRGRHRPHRGGRHCPCRRGHPCSPRHGPA